MLKRQNIIAGLRGNEYNECCRKASLYWQYQTIEQIEHYQVAYFNKMWQEIIKDVPFYEIQKQKYSLPTEIKSLNELREWPVLTKQDLRTNQDLFIRKSGPPDGYTMTGGSTWEPFRFGTWKGYPVASVNQWIGRFNYNVSPEMKTFYIWGHRHLYGSGLKGQIKKGMRRIKDIFMNSYRMSAFDLSVPALNAILKKMLKHKPQVIVAYSASVLAFCKANQNSQQAIKDLGIKCVICTAGPLSESEQHEISLFFNAPVCMEYGSMEAGVMAYTIPKTSEYKVFWDTHLIETEKDKFGYRNIVTNLMPTYLPLIRFDIGDYLELSYSSNELRPLFFKSVTGRPNDIITLPNGTTFNGILIGGYVKDISKVTAFQLIVNGNTIQIHFTAIGELTNDEIQMIKNGCIIAVPDLKNSDIQVIRKDKLRQTPAGKIPLVVFEN
ncbi:MAG: hypothetical protein FWD66_01920 [Paludibacter sp.]|nr:hypothetical protein [Paludibacter sp.]